jgi:hypothetical protein
VHIEDLHLVQVCAGYGEVENILTVTHIHMELYKPGMRIFEA